MDSPSEEGIARSNTDRRILRLAHFLTPSAAKIALLFLHTSVSSEAPASQRETLETLWNNAVVRCAADSGANFLYDISTGQRKPLGHASWSPDIVSGDFDSIRPEVLEYYRSQSGTQVIYTEDQNETDFTKALRLLVKELNDRGISNVESIVVYFSPRGRFDHVMASVNTLLRAHTITDIPVIMMSSEDIQVALGSPGRWELVLDSGFEARYCGLLPFTGPTTVSSQGLKWNLDKQVMQFGDLVSTSNEYVDKRVIIDTDGPLLWTMSIK